MAKVKDRTGLEYGRLVAKYFVNIDKNKHATWMCRCSCENMLEVCCTNLVSGNTESCGCLHKEQVSLANTKHGKSSTVEYIVWKNMKARCYNKNNKHYKNYGGRGITVCDHWLHSFEHFYVDMGKRPTKHTIDRIDNEDNYFPDNCKWSMAKEQANNTRKQVPFYAISPIGRFYRHHSQALFAGKHKNLVPNAICMILSGNLKQYNGWRFFLVRD